MFKKTVLAALLITGSALAHELSFENYLKAQEALAADDFKSALSLHQKICKDELGHYNENYPDCEKKFKGIKDLRNSFKKLSQVYIENGKKEEIKKLQKVNCSMAKADWVQKKGEIANPYYGKSMLTCGEKI